MGRALRKYEADGFYFVTARTFQSRLLLRPSPQLSEVIGGVLASGCRLTGVQLCGFVATSNHLHLLCRSRDGSLSRFMQYVLANIAKKAGRLVGWPGQLWQRRFAAEPVLDDISLERRLRYILAHGVKEGLVRQVTEWPGLSCVRQLLGERVRPFHFFEWARRWKGGRLTTSGKQPWARQWTRTELLELHLIPTWEHLTDAQRRERTLQIVRDIEAEYRPQFKSVSGLEAVLKRNPHSVPAKTKHERKPWFHAANKAAGAAYMWSYRLFVSAFKQASVRFRAGDWSVTFPPLAFRPWVPLRV